MTASLVRCGRRTHASTAIGRLPSRRGSSRCSSTACGSRPPMSSRTRSVPRVGRPIGLSIKSPRLGDGSAVTFDSLDAISHPARAAGSTLDAVAEAASICALCKLAGGRTQVVFGVGRADADLMFVGEGPGEQEDLKGEPFVGRAGQLLTQLIEGIGLTRD